MENELERDKNESMAALRDIYCNSDERCLWPDQQLNPQDLLVS